MDWSLRDVEIKGDSGFLQELEAIIDKYNPSAELWLRTGHIADILGDLHINIKPYANLRLYWPKAIFNNTGHLIITEEAAPWIPPGFADIFKKTFPDKISGINYRVIY